ncbi:hypothetical protein TNCV_2895771 [Trichonephila clavipes]|nr:hypothetical protein TNCV_2895771 [Trichonephila clavipes]
MIVQFRNEKVSNHGSIPITIDCNVVAFIVFEEGFHQPIKRTKQKEARSRRAFCDGAINQRKQVARVNRKTAADEVSRKKQWRGCQVIYSQFGLAIHQNDHQARRRFVEWTQNEIAVVPDFHKRILFSYEAHFWLNGYVNKQNCRIWSEANPQVYVETPLHPEKLTVWCALWAGGILLQKR